MTSIRLGSRSVLASAGAFLAGAAAGWWGSAASERGITEPVSPDSLVEDVHLPSDPVALQGEPPRDVAPSDYEALAVALARVEKERDQALTELREAEKSFDDYFNPSPLSFVHSKEYEKAKTFFDLDSLPCPLDLLALVEAMSRDCGLAHSESLIAEGEAAKQVFLEPSRSDAYIRAARDGAGVTVTLALPDEDHANDLLDVERARLAVSFHEFPWGYGVSVWMRAARYPGWEGGSVTYRLHPFLSSQGSQAPGVDVDRAGVSDKGGWRNAFLARFEADHAYGEVRAQIDAFCRYFETVVH